jgi:ferritin-like metal-binding protein YciE
MPVKDPKEMFLLMLSHVREGAEHGKEFYQELSQMAQDPHIKEALTARVFVSEKVLSSLDQCFKIIGKQPVALSGRLREAFIEESRKELAEIQSPVAKRLFILSKAIHLTHLRIGEYVALIAAADVTGNYGVGVLLESCLADKLAFVERTRRFIRHIVETELAERRAA